MKLKKTCLNKFKKPKKIYYLKKRMSFKLKLEWLCY